MRGTRLGSLPANAEIERLALDRDQSLADLMRRPEIDYAALALLGSPVPQDTVVAEQVEIQLKYAGYIARQQAEIARSERNEGFSIPADFDYSAVKSLSFEVRQRLAQQRPTTVGQAARISGVTPAAISLLLVHLKKRQRESAPEDDGQRAA